MMLTRLKVSGFKNLVDVDVRFGPFTCIAGPNGVGKSNLFDAIKFLSLLSEKTLLEAVEGIRGGENGPRYLFNRQGPDQRSVMSFEAEMIVPRQAWDDLGQQAEASATFLVYSLELGLRGKSGPGLFESLEVEKEELRHISKGQAHRHLRFPHAARHWRDTVVFSGRRTQAFLSTSREEGERPVIRIHQDGGSRGRPLLLEELPRTVLSVVNTAESPTAVAARREMRSWRILQLEPSALRKPDPLVALASSPRLSSDGAHLPATLFRLQRESVSALESRETDSAMELSAHGSQVFAQAANRLSELYENVRSLRVDLDEKREILTLIVQGRDGTEHPAALLSDGSLRFLALAVLELDPEEQGVVCLEEPENCVHPERLSAMLDLLRDIAVDAHEAVDEDNPLRQVIINTHSPAVVTRIPGDDLLYARPIHLPGPGGGSTGLGFGALPGTWRAKSSEEMSAVPLGVLLSYLNSVFPLETRSGDPDDGSRVAGVTVFERDDVQRQLPLSFER